MKPGIHYGMPMAEYARIPAVSAGSLRILLDECAAAARHAREEEQERDEQARQRLERGTTAHAILLEGSEACVEIIDPADHPNANGKGHASGWTNNSIRAARDDARARGKVPMLPDAMLEVRQMVLAAQAFTASLKAAQPAVHAMFQDGGGHSEATIVWHEGETLCKARADRISTDLSIICDYKTTTATARPDRWSRNHLYGMGYDVSVGWYRRGVRALTGKDPDYVFLVGECTAPYLHSMVGLTPADVALADERAGAGLREWLACVKAGEYPGYPSDVVYCESPAWHRMQWDERNGTDAQGIPYDPAKLWGAPRDPFKPVMGSL